MIDAKELVGTVFSGLSALVVEDVADGGGVIVVRARTRDVPVACPGCGTETARVHGYHDRTAADVPVDGRRVLVRVRAPRLRCAALGCPRQTFREQVPGVLDCYQRGTARLTGQLSAVARELAGRASVRLLPQLGITASRHTMLRVLVKIPLPVLAVPRVLGTGDFALRRGSIYATVLIDAETGRRAGTVEGRTADIADKWLRDHPGTEVVCRDGSGAYGEAARRALPGAVQVSDRWHLWHLLAEAVRKEVAAHCACWAKGMPLQEGKRAATTAERWQQVHDLRPERGPARVRPAPEPVTQHRQALRPRQRAAAVQRVPKYRPTLVDPYRDYLRKRRAEDPAVPPAQLLREIRELGYPGSMNLLVRYINQGRLDSDRPHLSPRRAARILLTRPDRLTGGQAEIRARLESACPEMTTLTALISSFARMLAPARENGTGLQAWITAAREADLPVMHSFTRGLDLDIHAVTAALTLPFHNGRTEGVNTKTKMIKRQMYGRACFTLLRHRILLG